MLATIFYRQKSKASKQLSSLSNFHRNTCSFHLKKKIQKTRQKKEKNGKKR